MKKLAMICTILTIAFMIAVAIAMPAVAETEPVTAVILGSEEVENGLWKVDCLVNDGNVWSFLADCDEWEQGEIARLFFDEDEITDVEWLGYFDLGTLVDCLTSM